MVYPLSLRFLRPKSTRLPDVHALTKNAFGQDVYGVRCSCCWGLDPCCFQECPPPLDAAESPLRESFGILAFTVAKTSFARVLRGSFTSVPSQALWHRIQADASAHANAVPRTTIAIRGGNDFLSGISGTSSTLTVGISLASCTLANSYSLVRVSKMASCTLVWRYRSAYVTPSSGSFRIDGYKGSPCPSLGPVASSPFPPIFSRDCLSSSIRARTERTLTLESV